MKSDPVLVLSAPFMMRKLLHDQWLKPSELRKLQDKRLRGIVKHSYENVPYYRNVFKQAKITPNDIKTTDDLTKIPILTKKDLKNLTLDKICATNVDLTHCLKEGTSVSSGTPLLVFWTKKAKIDCYLRALRWQLKCGDKISNKQAVLAAGWLLTHPIQRIGIFRTKYISGINETQAIIEQLKKFKPDTLVTLPSFIILLGKEIKENPSNQISIKHAFVGGEMIDEYSRRICKETFNVDLHECYGANEVGFLAAQCPERIIQHTEADTRFIEIIKNNQRAAQGEEGDIVVTNLTNYATPLIRYNLEDLGMLLDDECSCGSSFPLFKITLGRKSDIITLPNNKTVSAVTVYTLLIPIEGIKQFQLVQERKDTFRVKIVKDSRFSNSTRQEIASVLEQRLGRTKINIELVDDIPREKSGKYKQL